MTPNEHAFEPIDGAGSGERALQAQNVATIQAEGINYTNKLAVPPGEYGVWFVLRDNPSGRTGSVSVPLKVQ